MCVCEIVLCDQYIFHQVSVYIMCINYIRFLRTWIRRSVIAYAYNVCIYTFTSRIDTNLNSCMCEPLSKERSAAGASLTCMDVCAIFYRMTVWVCMYVDVKMYECLYMYVCRWLHLYVYDCIWFLSVPISPVEVTYSQTTHSFFENNPNNCFCLGKNLYDTYTSWRIDHQYLHFVSLAYHRHCITCTICISSTILK